MIHEFDILVLDGGNLVICDDLNILISLSVLIEEDIDHIFALKMTKICFETQEGITDILDIFKVQEQFFTFFNSKLHGLFKNVHNFLSWTIRKMTIFRKLSWACFVGHPQVPHSHSPRHQHFYRVLSKGIDKTLRKWSYLG